MVRAARRLVRTLLVDALLNAIVIMEGKPKARWEHGPDRIIDRAEKPLPHPEGQLDSLSVQNRRLIQQSDERLEPFIRAGRLANGQNDPLDAAISRPKGHDHPHAGLCPSRKLQRDEIVIRLVNGIGGR